VVLREKPRNTGFVLGYREGTGAVHEKTARLEQLPAVFEQSELALQIRNRSNVIWVEEFLLDTRSWIF